MSYMASRIRSGICRTWITVFLACYVCGGVGASAAQDTYSITPESHHESYPHPVADSLIHIQATSIPFSYFASPQAKEAFSRKLSTPGPKPGSDITSYRLFYARYNNALAARMKELYPVEIEPAIVGGVNTKIVKPKGGVSSANQGRILINLHGGAFLWGEGSGGEVESIPIASIGKIAVISVDYRQGPENTFPAASEDVAAVYADLLKRYKPQDIGMYGCSAGGILTAEAIAWFEKVKLPIPGAVGTFCGSITEFRGDSAYLGPVLTGEATIPTGGLLSLPYFRTANPKDPLVFPINSPDVMAKFPPTLLVTGSRDFALSSLLQTETALTKVGVKTELHVWDGMWHAFFMDPDLPESNDVYRIIVEFFSRHLGVR